MNREIRLRLLGLLGIASLWFLQFQLRPQPSGAHGGALEGRFSRASDMIFTAGFRPLVVQYLWADFATAYQEGRPFEALGDLQVLVRADAGNARAIRFMALIMAIDLADRESTPKGKMDRILEGIRALEWAERRRGPLAKDPSLPLARGLLFGQAWARDPRLKRSYTQRRGRSPQEDAWQAFRRALKLDPSSPRIRLEAARAARIRGIELIHERRGADALALLDEALRISRPLQGSKEPGFCAAWRELSGALAEGPVGRFPGALDGLAAQLRAWPDPAAGGDGSEDLFAWSVLGYCFQVAEREAQRGDPAAALSVLRALGRIQALVAQRLGSHRELLPPALGYRDRWKKAVAAIVRRAPTLKVAEGELELPPGPF